MQIGQARGKNAQVWVAWVRLSSVGGGEVIDHGMESKSSMTLAMHPPLGQPYNPFLPDEADANTGLLQKDSRDLDPHSIDLKHITCIWGVVLSADSPFAIDLIDNDSQGQWELLHLANLHHMMLFVVFPIYTSWHVAYDDCLNSCGNYYPWCHGSCCYQARVTCESRTNTHPR